MSSVGRQLIKASLEFTTTGRGRLPTNEANQRSKLHLGYRYSRQAAAVDRREEAAYHVRSAFVSSRWAKTERTKIQVSDRAGRTRASTANGRRPGVTIGPGNDLKRSLSGFTDRS